MRIITSEWFQKISSELGTWPSPTKSSISVALPLKRVTHVGTGCAAHGHVSNAEHWNGDAPADVVAEQYESVFPTGLNAFGFGVHARSPMLQHVGLDGNAVLNFVNMAFADHVEKAQLSMFDGPNDEPVKTTTSFAPGIGGILSTPTLDSETHDTSVTVGGTVEAETSFPVQICEIVGGE